MKMNKKPFWILLLTPCYHCAIVVFIKGQLCSLQKEKTMKVQTCQFVSATDLVPKRWAGWFWEAISENAPFSWGDNNRSMVDASFFADHCEERLDSNRTISRSVITRFLNKVRSLGDMYIDLES
jgi:hypothetical protein